MDKNFVMAIGGAVAGTTGMVLGVVNTLKIRNDRKRLASVERSTEAAKHIIEGMNNTLESMKQEAPVINVQVPEQPAPVINLVPVAPEKTETKVEAKAEETPVVEEPVAEEVVEETPAVVTEEAVVKKDYPAKKQGKNK